MNTLYAIAAVIAALASLVGAIATLLNRGKLTSVQGTVNGDRAALVARVEQLSQHIAASGQEIPPSPPKEGE